VLNVWKPPTIQKEQFMDNGKPKQTLCGPRGYGLKKLCALVDFSQLGGFGE
jgi:hypothetical protein